MTGFAKRPDRQLAFPDFTVGFAESIGVRGNTRKGCKGYKFLQKLAATVDTVVCHQFFLLKLNPLIRSKFGERYNIYHTYSFCLQKRLLIFTAKG
jgi:hypothetical protein